MADNITALSGGAVQGAYRNSLGLKSTDAIGAPEAPQQTSFADMVQGAASDAIQTIREADQVARAGMAEEAGTQQVVEAAIALESTVKIAVSMRDKLVAAYQEVMRMPI